MLKRFLLLSCAAVVCFLSLSAVSAGKAAATADSKLEISSAYSEAALLPDVSVDVDVLVTIKAPVVPLRVKRPPVAVSLVIDRSGSMAEAKKIDYARTAAKTLVRSLEPDDLLALTIYDDVVETPVPLGRVKNKAELVKLIDGIEPRGWTFLSGGLQAGIEQLAKVKSEGPARVILLSDGLANKGITSPELIAAIGSEARAKGIGVSAIGLGLDFDEDLMQHLAQRGGGQYYYIADSESLPSVFRDELALVVNSYTKDLKVVLRPGATAGQDAPAKVYGYTTTGGAEATNIEMSDLSSGEERQVMLRLRVTPQAGSGTQKLGEMQFDYVDQAGGAVQKVTVPLELAVVKDKGALEKAAEAKAPELRLVKEEALLRRADEMHLEAMADLAKGDVLTARQRLRATKDIIAPAAPANKIIASKLEQLSLDETNLDQAATDAEMRSQMAKAGKSSAYMSHQGKKAGNLLRSGDSGYMVERLQKALAEKGYYQGAINGEFGSELEKAVQSFQKDNKLDADGIAGATTLHALGLTYK